MGAGDLAQRLACARAALRRYAPQLVERVEGGGHMRRLVYETPQGQRACRLVLDPPNLLLHFADGAALADPRALLLGAGRRGRYLCLRSAALLDDPAVAALIGAAARRAAGLCSGRDPTRLVRNR